MEFGELGEAVIRDSVDPPHHPEWRLGLEVSSNVFGTPIKYTFDNDENAPSVTQFLQGTGSQVTRKNMEVKILDNLKAYSDLKEAQVQKLEQVIELEKAEQEMVRQVKEAYFDYHKAEIRVRSSLKKNQYRQRLVEPT
jgi:outer membrane protein TolC